MDLTDDVDVQGAAEDPQAFREVYGALAPRVQGYLRSRGVEDPDGLTGEVFLGIYPRLPTLQGGAAGLSTLVSSVAHARSVDDVRRRTRRPVDLGFPEPPARE